MRLALGSTCAAMQKWDGGFIIVIFVSSGILIILQERFLWHVGNVFIKTFWSIVACFLEVCCGVDYDIK